MLNRNAKFSIGEVVKHRIHPFRGVIFDVDPTFDNTEEWWNSIPENHRPKKDQPFYHLLAENDSSYYIAYVSEQNLLYDDSGEPCVDICDNDGKIMTTLHPNDYNEFINLI